MVNEMSNELCTDVRLRWTPLAGVLAGALVCTAAGTARADATVTQLATVTAHSATTSNVSVDQRVRAQLRAVMTELVETGAFGDQSLQQMSLAWWAGAVKDGLRMRVDTTAYKGISLGLGEPIP